MTKKNLNRVIFNASTGEELVIDLTEAEIAQYELDEADNKAKFKAKEAELIAKAEAKAELLKKLGITAEEAALLLS
jgi:competence protein ComGC